jgi:hypothetical protein
MRRTHLLSSCVAFLLAACAATAPEPEAQAPGAPPPKSADADKAEQQKKAEEKKQREKELAQKRRELEYAKVSVQTAGIDRQVRSMSVDTAVARAQLELDKHKRELDLFLTQHKPREMEERRIGLDHQIYRAEEAKEELAELEAMYKEDEFARSTKELVVKRGRRQMEMADRSLAVGKKEFELFERHTLTERERDLKQKVKDAEQELEKARLEHQKAQLEMGVQQRQADDRVGDLQRDIEELERKLAEDGK